MRNFISCFVLVVSNVAFGQLFTQKDTLRFAPDSSYSRIVLRLKTNKLVFGTSKTGVIVFDENLRTTETIIPKNQDGEFRDLIVSDKQMVFGMISGDNGVVLSNSSISPFTLPYDEGAFYDDLVQLKKGFVVLGDPINGLFTLRYAVQTFGKKPLHEPHIPAFKGEACYAGSGTTAQLAGKNDYCFVSGGGNSARFHRFSLKDTSTYFFSDLPMSKGEGAGPFSVCFMDSRNGAIVGGNYLAPNDTTGAAVYSVDGGNNWLPSAKQPNGYRCCVTGTKKLLFCAGTNGIDYSTDGGKTWYFFDKGYFCALLLEGNKLYATTNKGYCIRYQFTIPH